MNPEVLIIGGGVVGLSIARELHKNGVKRITLLDKGACGREASWAAAGILSPLAEADRADEFFELCSTARDLYPGFAEELLAETGIDVELDRTGTLYLAFTDDNVAELDRRFKWQQAVGLRVERLSADDVCRAEPFVSADVSEALFFPNDWQVENRKLLAALERYARINGIEIRENTSVEKLRVENDKVTGAATNAGTVTADVTVVATGAWTSLIKLGDAEMPVKIEPVRGQMIALRGAERLFRHVIYSRRGYVVPRLDGRVLAGSTTENVGFDRSTTENAITSLSEMATEISPTLGGLEIADRWAGLRPFASDGLPVFGTVGGLERVFVATAHYRNGILLAPLTAKLVANAVVNGVASPDLTAFGADRFCLRGVAVA